jgi:hypothetical protein
MDTVYMTKTDTGRQHCPNCGANNGSATSPTSTASSSTRTRRPSPTTSAATAAATAGRSTRSAEPAVRPGAKPVSDCRDEGLQQLVEDVWVEAHRTRSPRERQQPVERSPQSSSDLAGVAVMVDQRHAAASRPRSVPS